MALPAQTFAQVKAMSPSGRTSYFQTYGRYFPDSPNKPYAIRVGSKTFFSNDTMDLRKQFDKGMRYHKERA